MTGNEGDAAVANLLVVIAEVMPSVGTDAEEVRVMGSRIRHGMHSIAAQNIPLTNSSQFLNLLAL